MNPYIVQGVTLVFYDGEREDCLSWIVRLLTDLPNFLKSKFLTDFPRGRILRLKVNLK